MIALVALVLAAAPVDGPRVQVALIAETPGEALAQGRRDLAADNPAGAIESFRRPVRADGNDVAALLGLAESYDRIGRVDEARGWFEVALAADPASPDVALAYGEALVRAQDLDARDLLDRAAAGGDPGIRERALAALDRLTAEFTYAVPETHEAPIRTWIERTSDTEQRLVIDRHDNGSATTELAGAEALVSAATAWSAADEARMARLVRAEDAAAAPPPVSVLPPAAPLPELTAVIEVRTAVMLPARPSPAGVSIAMPTAPGDRGPELDTRTMPSTARQVRDYLLPRVDIPAARIGRLAVATVSMPGMRGPRRPRMPVRAGSPLDGLNREAGERV